MFTHRNKVTHTYLQVHHHSTNHHPDNDYELEISQADMDAIQEEVDQCEHHMSNMFRQSKSTGQSACQLNED